MRRFFLLFISLFIFIGMRAGTVEVKTNVWSGTQEMDANWSNWLNIPSSDFNDAEVGNILSVYVSQISASYGQVMLNTGSWAAMPGAESAKVVESAPCELKWVITEDMLAELKGGGLIIKGVGYDLSSVDIKHKVVKGDSANKGNAFTNIWTGSEVISWTQGSNNSVFVNAADLADKLADAKAGDKLRMSYSGLGFGTAQGKILANWTSLTDLQTAKFTGGSYFEYTLTDEWLTAIKEKGLRVSGIGYTLNSIDLVTPEKEYCIIAQNDDADIKAWEGDETPKLGMTITNIETWK